MNNFSKIIVGSSVVLGAVLFSVGCGGDSFCCKDGIAPIPEITSIAKGAKFTVPDNGKLTVNGTGYDEDGTIKECKWYIDGKLQSTDGGCDSVTLNFDTSKTADHEVCLAVVDNDNIKSTVNNGTTKSSINNGATMSEKTRVKMDCRVATVTATSSPTPSENEIKIYNARTNKLVSENPIKQACPFYAQPVNQLPANTTCKWTVDGVEKGNNCNGLTNQNFNDLSNHEVCLIVNGDTEHKMCKTLAANEHSQPKAVLGIYTDSNMQNKFNNDTLDKDTKYFLSCNGSKNDCPEDNSGLECTWNASSYDTDANGNCDFTENRNYHYQDCFNNPNHTGHGSQITIPKDGNYTYQYICGSAKGKCVEIKLTVKDKRFQPSKSKTVIKRFKVSN